MECTSGVKKQYTWGSDTVIQEYFGVDEPSEALTEVWSGVHRLSPSTLLSDESADLTFLADWISADPEGTLGVPMVERFGARLPYSIKLIASKRPLPLQAHPDREYAQLMFDIEKRVGIPLDTAQHVYKDSNHESELIHVLARFEASAGLHAPRCIVEIFSDLDMELVTQIVSQLHAQPSPKDTREVIDRLLSPHATLAAPQIEATVTAMSDRSQVGVSPPVRVDRVITSLACQYSGDAGAVVATMLNSVSFRPGEVLFTSPGGIHVYTPELDVEVMTNSGDVLRTGLTKKYVDYQKPLNCLDYVAALLMWVAPGWVTDSTQVFYALVDDFELSVTKPGDPQLLPGHGGRIALRIEGEAILSDVETDQLRLLLGRAAFMRVDKILVYVSGHGVVIQSGIP